MFLTGTGLIALAPQLDADAQHSLAEAARGSGDTYALTLLAGRYDLAPAVARRLARDPSPTVRTRALSRTPAPEECRHVTRRELAAVAANLHTDPQQLARLARYDDGTVMLRALCNPNTPEQTRKHVLSDPAICGALVNRTTPVGAHVVRAGELTANNRWLLEKADLQSDKILRGLLSLPECPEDTLRRHRAKAARWVSAAKHPTLTHGGAERMSTDQLASSPSAASHLALLDRDDATAEHAGRIISAEGHGQPAEPHIVARIVRRWGSAPFLHIDPATRPYAGTRVATAGWAEAAAHDLLDLLLSWGNPLRADDIRAAAEAADMLGSDQELWHVFARLARHHDPAGGLTGQVQLARDITWQNTPVR